MANAREMKEAGRLCICVYCKWHLGFGNESPIDWNKELKSGLLEPGFDY
jgi:hypothetical protein